VGELLEITLTVRRRYRLDVAAGDAEPRQVALPGF
jgi:hypothetical protein